MAYPATPKTWVAGDVLTAAQLNAELRDALLGAFPLGPPDLGWTDFTPVITQGATPPFTKNYSKYSKIGRTVFWNFGLTLTGAGTAGNRVGITVPVVAAAAVVGMDIGVARIYDVAPGTLYDGVANLNSTTVLFISTQWSDTWGVLPNLALASGDVIRGSVQFEAAS